MSDTEKIFLICDFYDPSFCDSIRSSESVISLIDASLDDEISLCQACGGCNFVTPGTCLINDPCQQNANNISKCDVVIIISRNTFGCYSPFAKKVIERSIGYISVFFKTRHGPKGTKHYKRNRNRFHMVNLFYGVSTEKEKKTAEALANQTAYLLNADQCSVLEKETVEECIEHVRQNYFSPN